MTLTTHLLAGAIIGSKLSNPISGFVFGFLSHYILDAFPHREYHIGDWNQAKESLLKKDFKNSGVKFYRIILDGLLGMSLTAFIFVFQNQNLSIPAGVFGGFLPDLLWGLYFLYPKVKLPQQGLGASADTAREPNPAPKALRLCTFIPKLEFGVFWCGVILKKHAQFHDFMHIAERTIPDISKKIPRWGKVLLELTILLLSLILISLF